MWLLVYYIIGESVGLLEVQCSSNGCVKPRKQISDIGVCMLIV